MGGGDFFYQEFGIWGGVILNIPIFSKLKAAFGDWKSIKNKISMTSDSKEYEIKTKMVHEQWWQLTFSTALVGVGVGGTEIWWGEFFQLWRGKSKFLAGEGTPSPHALPVENTLEDDCMLFCYIVWSIESDKVGSPYFAVPY